MLVSSNGSSDMQCYRMAFEESTVELLEVARLRYCSTVAEAKASLNRAFSYF